MGKRPRWNAPGPLTSSEYFVFAKAYVAVQQMSAHDVRIP